VLSKAEPVNPGGSKHRKEKMTFVAAA